MATFHAQHPTFHIHHITSNISHPSSHTQHITSNTPYSTFSTSLFACEISVPILRTAGAICVVDKHPAWFLCRSAICGRTFPCRMPHSKSHIPHLTSIIPHPSSHTQHSTFNIPHPTFHIPHFTYHTPHSQHPSLPAKYLCLSSAPAAQSVLLTSTPHGFCVDLWHLREKYSCAAWHIPNPIFHLPHPTSNISHSTFHILNTPPPNLHGFSRRAPPRVQIRHSQRVIATT